MSVSLGREPHAPMSHFLYKEAEHIPFTEVALAGRIEYEKYLATLCDISHCFDVVEDKS